MHREGGPGFTAIGVTLVGCGAAKGEGETDNETEDCKEKGVDADCWRWLVESGRSSGVGNARSLTNLEMQVISVAHDPIRRRGRIILGRTEPCMRMK